MKFRIRGIRRISIPAIRATIGCSSAALMVKVIGLAPCSLEGFKRRQDGRAAATRSGPRSRQPRVSRRRHNHHAAIVAAAVIPDAAPEQEDQQDDDQNQFHNGYLRSTSAALES